MKQFIIALMLTATSFISYGQEFKLIKSYLFKPQNKKVKLLENSNKANIIVFKTNMAINTDGTPWSYHPYDLPANSKALNYMENGVAIYRLSDSRCISIPRKDTSEYPKRFRKNVKFDPNKISDKEKKEFIALSRKVFEEWRDAGYPEKQIDGYEIIWQNVIVNKDGKPCIFKKNKQFEGYFASMTHEQNDIKNDTSECQCANQLDPFKIPSIVLNDGIKYGASLGDLVAAYNPETKILVYAIIGDSGPGNNLGEGSILLNTKLKGVKLPKGRDEIKALPIDDNIYIGIIPKSKKYKLVKPYTEESIKERVNQWFSSQGYGNKEEIIKLLINNNP
jgi:hypothetical protein